MLQLCVRMTWMIEFTAKINTRGIHVCRGRQREGSGNFNNYARRWHWVSRDSPYRIGPPEDEISPSVKGSIEW